MNKIKAGDGSSIQNNASAELAEQTTAKYANPNTTTRSDKTDLGVAMRPGSGKERVELEDALSDEPTRGDYSGRLGGADYRPHQTRPIEDAKPGKPGVETVAQIDLVKQIEDADENPVSKAKAKIEQIKSAIVAGDESLTSGDLASARAELEFAELSAQAADIAERNRIEAERREKVLSLGESLRELHAEGEGLEKELPEFTKTLGKVLARIREHNQKIGDVRGELGALGVSAGSEAVEGVSIDSMGWYVSFDGLQLRVFNPKEKVTRLVEAVYAENFAKR